MNMIEELKDKVLNWYDSLAERDKKIVVIFIAFLLPAISIYIYSKETAKRGEIEQKISSLPSLEQLRNQSINIEKQIVYYKEQIPKLSAMLLNPNVKYAYATTPNQIPIVLSYAISQAGGYITSLEEGVPKDIVVDENGNAVAIASGNINKKKTYKSYQSNKMFNIEIVPVKLSVAVSQDNISSLFSLLNQSNPSFPFLIVKTINFGFGKSQCSTNIFENSSYYTLNFQNNSAKTINTIKPTIVCLSGYVISNVSSEPITSIGKTLRGNENGKTK